MSTAEFIASGILESYVAGTASPEEVRKVQEMAKLHPELKEEIEQIEASMMSYAENFAGDTTAAEKKIRTELFGGGAKIIPITAAQKTNRFMAVGIAASLVLLLGSLYYNMLMSRHIDDVENELAKLTTQNEVMAVANTQYQKDVDRMHEQMSMMMKPGNKMVELKGMENAPLSSAMVFWNAQDKSVYLNVASLPMPPSGMQYQLWALKDGKPIDAGVFEVGDTAEFFQKMKDMDNAQAFAVTLEKKGGSPTPTMTAMYLMGNV
jgi:anti-sigma-K factor RskA